MSIYSHFPDFDKTIDYYRKTVLPQRDDRFIHFSTFIDPEAKVSYKASVG